MRWRIYYGDPGGMVYDGDCATHAYRAPNLNVQVYKEECRKEVDEKLYTLRKGCDYFCWEDEPVARWSGKGDKFGLYDYYHYHKGPQKVIFGREVYDEIYQRVMKQVKVDGNFERMNFQAGKCHRG